MHRQEAAGTLGPEGQRGAGAGRACPCSSTAAELLRSELVGED